MKEILLNFLLFVKTTGLDPQLKLSDEEIVELFSKNNICDCDENEMMGFQFNFDYPVCVKCGRFYKKEIPKTEAMKVIEERNRNEHDASYYRQR